jgi:hypothetical protein
MKKSVFVLMLFIVSIPLAFAGQNPPAPAAPGQAAAAPAPGTNALVDYTRHIKYDGLTLSVLLVNNRTVEVLFQAPLKYSMRARANQQTVLYIQGTPQKDFELSNAFTIEQDGQIMTGTSTSVKNFVNGKVPAGQRIDGVVEFQKKVDISKPFTVKNGQGEVQFILTPEAIKALAPPPPPGQ